MSHYSIGCDAHKCYFVFVVLDAGGILTHRQRVNHEQGAMRAFLKAFPKGTTVALECVGNWNWIVDEIEGAGCASLIARAATANRCFRRVGLGLSVILSMYQERAATDLVILPNG